VAFKLALAICEKGGYDPSYAWENSDVVTLGIAADLVPIQDENRIIVRHGIQQMKRKTNLGITALQKTGGLLGKEITVGRLVFWVTPKINAAGRLGDASRAVKLLTTQNPVLAKEIAEELEVENNRRKDITLQITNDALYMVKTNCDLENENAIVLGHKNWHAGVIGIVASRLIENYYKPTIVLAEKDGMLTGSARSVHDFDL
jgi:single-stranded-DNA-specific exonuclease